MLLLVQRGKVSRLGAQMVTCSSLGRALEVEEGSGCAFAVGRRDTEREREDLSLLLWGFPFFCQFFTKNLPKSLRRLQQVLT